MEIRHWLDDLFIEPEVPKKWLKERRPDLFNAVYAKTDHVSQKQRELAKQFDSLNVADRIVKYIDQHPDIKAVFWRRGGRPRTARLMKEHSCKVLRQLYLSIIAMS